MFFTYDVEEGLSRSIRDEPPLHYKFKINSFSLYSVTDTHRLESGIFEVDGHKWKLAIYPKGNKMRDVEEHISVYLVKVETSSQPHSWGVEVFFRFFVYDQIQDHFLIVQDLRSRRFHEMKTEYGFDRFISLKTFKDPSAGYLVNDTCLFGAEVFVLNKLIVSKSDCLTIKKENAFKHIWKIEKFSILEDRRYYSEAFTAGDYKWQIQFYPKGQLEAKNNHLSVYLGFDTSVTLAPDHRVHVEITLRIVDQNLSKHLEKKDQNWFSASHNNWGWLSFLSLSEFNDTSKGFLVKDCCIVEAEVKVLGLVKTMT